MKILAGTCPPPTQRNFNLRRRASITTEPIAMTTGRCASEMKEEEEGPRRVKKRRQTKDVSPETTAAYRILAFCRSKEDAPIGSRGKLDSLIGLETGQKREKSLIRMNLWRIDTA